MYECEKENQQHLDGLNIKSKCCNADLQANSLDEWFCESCGKEIQPEVDGCQPLYVNKKEDGFPPTPKGIGIQPTIL